MGDEFANGGVANQPVILQRSVHLFCGQVSQGDYQFQSNFKWLPEIDDSLVDAVMYAFLNVIKKAGGSLKKFWYPGMSVCMRSVRRLL